MSDPTIDIMTVVDAPDVDEEDEWCVLTMALERMGTGGWPDDGLCNLLVLGWSEIDVMYDRVPGVRHADVVAGIEPDWSKVPANTAPDELTQRRAADVMEVRRRRG